MTTSSNIASQGAAGTLPPPQLTITVRSPATVTVSPSPQGPIQIAAQPTPIVYTVQENDTLLDIAFQFGLTVEDLQLANPGIDPLTLQIGQALTIPVNTNTRSIDPLQLLPPPPLPVTSPTCYQTSTESLVCLGTLTNNQNQAVEGIRVAVQVIGLNGEVLSQRTVTTEHSFVLPGEQAPYRVLLEGLSESEVGGLVAGLETGSLTDTLAERFAPVMLENIETSIDGQQYVVSAEVLNPTENTVGPPRLVLTVLDERGNIYGYRVWEPDGPLPAGGRLPVRLAVLPIGLDGRSPEILSHTLHLEAQRSFDNMP